MGGEVVYFAMAAGAWKAADRSPMERATVRGPGLDGTLVGPNAVAEARARAQQLNVAYQAGVLSVSRGANAADLNAAFKRGLRAGKREAAKIGARRKRR